MTSKEKIEFLSGEISDLRQLLNDQISMHEILVEQYRTTVCNINKTQDNYYAKFKKLQEQIIKMQNALKSFIHLDKEN